MRFLLVLCLFLVGCTNSGRDIAVRVGECCPLEEAATFVLKTQNIPGFLEPIFASNLKAVLAASGFQPVETGSDVIVIMRYEQDELSSGLPHDAFEEGVSEGEDVRFVARIVVEMEDVNGVKMFSGAIDRIHNISPGEYMHTGNASKVIYEALAELLKDLRR